MHRWFPVPALLAAALWLYALGPIPAGWSGPSALRTWSATVATLAIHAGVLAWGLRRSRRVEAGPEWVRVQDAKHRRKGAWFARWGLAALGMGWFSSRAVPGDPAAWFVACFELGCQPAIFVAEWATIAAEARLMRATVAGRNSGGSPTETEEG